MSSEKDQSLETKMLNHFEIRAEEHLPDNPSRMAWVNKKSQETRFELLYRIGFKNENSIYDVGCGVGALYGYLLQRGFKGRYRGCDLVAKNCNDAAEIYQRPLFEHGGFSELFISENYDFVFASGIFFLNSTDWDIATRALIKKMYEYSQLAVVVNFLSDRTPGAGLPHQKFCNPWEIIGLCTNFVNKYQVLHNYSTPENGFVQEDFTLILEH